MGCLRYIMCFHTLLPMTCLRKGGQTPGEHFFELKTWQWFRLEAPWGKAQSSDLISVGHSMFPLWLCCCFSPQDSKTWASNPMMNERKGPGAATEFLRLQLKPFLPPFPAQWACHKQLFFVFCFVFVILWQLEETFLMTPHVCQFPSLGTTSSPLLQPYLCEGALQTFRHCTINGTLFGAIYYRGNSSGQLPKWLCALVSLALKWG